MTDPAPWSWSHEDHEDRWNGYLLSPGSAVLRNKINALTVEDIARAENDLLEVRLAELREQPSLVDRTYDLAHFCSLHRHLFQDVYEWAGELRTVGMGKGGDDPFAPPLNIEQAIGYMSLHIRESNLLVGLRGEELVTMVTDLYDYGNYAHPFREGNGRAQREFFNQLLAESGHGLDWDAIVMKTLHTACHTARVDQDVQPLQAIFEQILTDDPAY